MTTDELIETLMRLEKERQAVAHWYLPALISALKENKRLREALVEIGDRLNCRGDADTAHYCPNCDNSLWNVRALALAALQPQGEK